MEISPVFLVLVPVVMALVQGCKNFIDSKWSPVVAIVFGILGAALIGIGSVSFPMIILQGILVGMTAAGIYSGAKSVAK